MSRDEGKAEIAKLAAVNALKETQAKLGRAKVGVERERLRAELAERTAELNRAKGNLRRINLSLSSTNRSSSLPFPAPKDRL